MAEIRKEERLFLEIGTSRGSISAANVEAAFALAKKQDVSVIEALLGQGSVPLEEADAIRKALFKLSFTCPECESLDFVELGQVPEKKSLCEECAEKRSSSGVKARPTPAPAAAPAPPAPKKPEAPPVEGLSKGAVLGGCSIEKQIGKGGMGLVFRAHHRGLDRAMAVKVLDEKLVGRQGFIEQFFVEARVLAKLDHPNVVRVFNVDKDSGGKCFLVMELLEGGSVDALWRKHKKKMPLDDALRVVREAAAGLNHAHEAGLIHRDVKPGNLMLTDKGRVKVVDFGLAVRTEGELFIATEIAGTPLYMAPEQADGLKLDHRCDQYGLAITLYQLLCGEAPFERKKAIDILMAHMSQEPPAPRTLRPDVPEWLERVILRALAKAPGDRYPSLREFLAALDEKVESKAPAAPLAGTASIEAQLGEILKLEKGLKPRPVPKPEWRPAVLAVAACIFLMLVFLVGNRDVFADQPGLDSVPASVRRQARDELARAQAASPEELVQTIARLEEEVSDMRSLPGAATLDELTTALKKIAAERRARVLAQLTGSSQDLLSKKLYARALDLADPDSRSLAALKLQAEVTALRASATSALEKDRGEVYVAPGPELPGFYIEKTEVTNAAYALVLEREHRPPPPGFPGSITQEVARKPVTGVSFEEAQAYARALGKRLPSSAEWERAARGPDERAYPWGPAFEPGRANLQDGGSGALEDVTARPGDVSPWGALGMAGNALEWVSGPGGPLVAGGCFRSHALSGRAFARFAPDPKTTRFQALGFRCARDLEAP